MAAQPTNHALSAEIGKVHGRVDALGAEMLATRKDMAAQHTDLSKGMASIAVTLAEIKGEVATTRLSSAENKTALGKIDDQVRNLELGAVRSETEKGVVKALLNSKPVAWALAALVAAFAWFRPDNIGG